MERSLVITLIGVDRPGLIEALAQAVVENGGNWLESRMARLAGHFAGVLRITAEAERVAAIERALAQLEGLGLRTVIEAAEEPAASRERPLTLELVGQDRPGIVRQISAVLAGFGINIETLTTDRSSAPQSGESIFRASMRLRVPDPVTTETLQRELERIAADLMVDVLLEPAEGAREFVSGA